MPDKIASLYSIFLQHPVVSTDSREIQTGCLFFALQGDNFNGNLFASRALEQGAARVIVDDPAACINDRCILVDDVLLCLQNLARHHRKQFAIPVIAITGTNGKTTTKELSNAVLSMKFRTLATRGNLNNHIGVPLTLLNLRPDTEIALIEMGANHPGEIDFLCHLAIPNFGLITNIGKAHLEGFGDFDGVIRTKTELYRFLQSANGKIFIHEEDPLLMANAQNLPVIPYGEKSSFLSATTISADPCLSLNLVFSDQAELNINSKLFGRYNADNLMAAACIGQYFGVEHEKIREALESYQPANNRSQIMQARTNLLILDAYNANPSSMKSALENFAASSYPDKTAILGDMLELGEASDQEHEHILDLLDEKGFTSVYLVGPVFTRLNKKRDNICFQDSDLAQMWFEHHPLTHTTILLKGSRGIKLEKITDLLMC